MPNDTNISAVPAIAINAIGTVNVHLSMPKLLKNTLKSGFIVTELTISPTTVDITIAGIKDNAVCKISCRVVNPNDLSMP